MNRELKFRVWHPIYGMMKPQDIFQMTSFRYDNEDGSKTLEKHYEPDVTFLQYTGIKDKNGVEIYEGDEVEFEQHDSWSDAWLKKSGIVVFDDGAFSPIPNNNSFIRNFKVIGNVHEN